MGSQGGEDSWQRWRLAEQVRWYLVERARLAEQTVPHLHADKLGGTTGEWDRLWNPGSQHGKIKLQTSDWKNLWGLRCGEKLPASQESVRDPQGPKMYTNPPTWESAPEGPNLLVASCRSDWKLAERSKQHCALSDPSPTDSITMPPRVAPPWWTPKAQPLTM